MCIREPHNQLNSGVNAQFPADTLQMCPNGSAGHPKKVRNFALVVAQHQALKNLDFSRREAQHFGDAGPSGFTEETTTMVACVGFGHRDHLSCRRQGGRTLRL